MPRRPWSTWLDWQLHCPDSLPARVLGWNHPKNPSGGSERHKCSLQWDTVTEGRRGDWQVPGVLTPLHATFSSFPNHETHQPPTSHYRRPSAANPRQQLPREAFHWLPPHRPTWAAHGFSPGLPASSDLPPGPVLLLFLKGVTLSLILQLLFLDLAFPDPPTTV